MFYGILSRILILRFVGIFYTFRWLIKSQVITYKTCVYTLLVVYIYTEWLYMEWRHFHNFGYAKRCPNDCVSVLFSCLFDENRAVPSKCGFICGLYRALCRFSFQCWYFAMECALVTAAPGHPQLQNIIKSLGVFFVIFLEFNGLMTCIHCSTG